MKGKLIDQIPPLEQQRIIQQSGVLNQFNTERQNIMISLVVGFLLACLQMGFDQLVYQVSFYYDDLNYLECLTMIVLS